jgi:DNA-binding transcriptional LysR family regulator
MNWDDLKLFLAVADAPSMRAAARTLKISHTTISRRIDALEANLNAKLFDRLTNGYQLTASGLELLPIARQTEENLHAYGRSVAGRDSALEGQVCVTIPDSLAVNLFMPLFISFMEEYPGIQLKINDSIQVFDLSRREADVALRLTHEPPEHLIGRCLGNMHQAAYATYAYLEAHPPEGANSTARWIGWGLPENRPAWIDRSPFPHLGVVGHFNNILLQLDAVRRSVGIGYFPCYLGDSAKDLVRLNTPTPSLPVWLLSHRDLRAAARMRAFRQFIIRNAEHIKARLEGDLIC